MLLLDRVFATPRDPGSTKAGSCGDQRIRQRL